MTDLQISNAILAIRNEVAANGNTKGRIADALQGLLNNLKKNVVHGVFLISDTGGSKMQLQDTIEGSFTGWNFSYQAGPDRFILTAPTGVKIKIITFPCCNTVSGGGVGSETFYCSTAINANVFQIYEPKLNGTSSPLNAVGSPRRISVKMEIE